MLIHTVSTLGSIKLSNAVSKYAHILALLTSVSNLALIALVE
jgi:hypothetical protein